MCIRISILKTADNLIGSKIIRLIPPASPVTHFKLCKRILVIRPGGIGDAVLLIPSIINLRQHFPDAIIDILAEQRNAAIFSLSPEINKIYNYDRPRELYDCIYNNYDVVIDTEQWHCLSGIVARLCRAPLTIGFATNERARLFNFPVFYSQDDYELVSFYHLLKPLRIEPKEDVRLPYLEIPSKVLDRARELLPDNWSSNFIVIFPGASIPERRWGVERFAAVASELEKHGLPMVVVGGKGDCASGELICGANGLNLAGKTSLAETAAVISLAKALISGDSGVLHMSVALNIPTVSLFGPGIALKWAPRGDRHIVINRLLSCSPCTKFGNTKSCRVGTRCMSDISIEEVTSAVMTILQREKALSAE